MRVITKIVFLNFSAFFDMIWFAQAVKIYQRLCLSHAIGYHILVNEMGEEGLIRVTSFDMVQGGRVKNVILRVT